MLSTLKHTRRRILANCYIHCCYCSDKNLVCIGSLQQWKRFNGLPLITHLSSCLLGPNEQYAIHSMWSPNKLDGCDHDIITRLRTCELYLLLYIYIGEDLHIKRKVSIALSGLQRSRHNFYASSLCRAKLLRRRSEQQRRRRWRRRCVNRRDIAITTGCSVAYAVERLWLDARICGNYGYGYSCICLRAMLVGCVCA